MSESKSLENLFQLVHLLKRQYHNKLEQLDIGIAPMHIKVLTVINKKSQCTAIDVSNFLGRDKSQVTRLLNVLINQELIVKEPNPGDKRSHCLSITSSGEAVMKQLSGIEGHMSKLMKKELNSEEWAEFQRVTEKMAETLRELD